VALELAAERSPVLSALRGVHRARHSLLLASRPHRTDVPLGTWATHSLFQRSDYFYLTTQSECFSSVGDES
jgi:hypothetical protein